MPKITFNCLNCGQEVQKYNSQAVKYCSHRCYTEHKAKNSFEKICPVRHKTYLGKVSQVYCSKSCRKKRQHEKEIRVFSEVPGALRLHGNLLVIDEPAINARAVAFRKDLRREA